MKKYSVCAIVDNFSHHTTIVMANNIFDIVDKYDNPTDEMMEILKKEDFNFYKDEIFLDIVCIDNDDIPSPYIINK